jgi:hypothetical protein
VQAAGGSSGVTWLRRPSPRRRDRALSKIYRSSDKNTEYCSGLRFLLKSSPEKNSFSCADHLQIVLASQGSKRLSRRCSDPAWRGAAA